MSEQQRQSRNRANINRSRILDAAMRCFAADPDASMDDVAKAAGVVRRTVYAHFPNREALVESIAEDAGVALADSLDHPEPDDVELALAVGVLRMSPVGDRYRMLLSFARKEVGDERISDLVAPVRNRMFDTIERGRASGVLPDHLPTVVLVAMMEGLTMATFEQVNLGFVDDAGEVIALAVLVLAGVDAGRARRVLDAAHRWLDDERSVADPRDAGESVTVQR
ncbi:TetR/AcrR family transcriptional regulator [Rhodococcus yananensis]|uniref:TetR/AcrR family transcriptional regulator n=1 Tax=Rhodococcus yananensis TaxID=2879464 RepID=UPI003EB7886D